MPDTWPWLVHAVRVPGDAGMSLAEVSRWPVGGQAAREGNGETSGWPGLCARGIKGVPDGAALARCATTALAARHPGAAYRYQTKIPSAYKPTPNADSGAPKIALGSPRLNSQNFHFGTRCGVPPKAWTL
jgi:hypothetical protein